MKFKKILDFYHHKIPGGRGNLTARFTIIIKSFILPKRCSFHFIGAFITVLYIHKTYVYFLKYSNYRISTNHPPSPGSTYRPDSPPCCGRRCATRELRSHSDSSSAAPRRSCCACLLLLAPSAVGPRNAIHAFSTRFLLAQLFSNTSKTFKRKKNWLLWHQKSAK